MTADRITTPECSVRLGAQTWGEQLLGVDVSLAAAPSIGVTTVELPATAPVGAVPGDAATVVLAGVDVMTGTVAAVRRGLNLTVVTVRDAASALARSRSATTYESVDAGTVIRALAGDAGVAVEDVDDGVPLVWYAADPSRTRLDHVARLAQWSGMLARTTAAGRLVATAVGATQADVALRYGRDVLSFAQTSRPSEVDAFTFAGEAGAGDTSVPEALRLTSDFFAGNRPAGPDGRHPWTFAPALRSTGAAAAAGGAAQWRYRAGREVAQACVLLHPTLRPGVVVTVAGLPSPLGAGPYWLGSVRHRVTARETVTLARLYRGGPAFDPLAVLAGGLAGASVPGL